MTTVDGIRLGTAPDSWGVWLPDDPGQTPWHRFLDEVVEAGYRWIELGPYGYLPTDPERLRDEIGRRGLTLSGGTVAGGLHRPETFEQVLADSREVARLLSALGARYLVFLPEMYRDIDEAGTFLQSPELTNEQWKDLVTGVSRLGRIINEEFGVSLVFHPHADSHVDTQDRVERLLDDTDPDSVSLCLDTGHISYCGGDNLALVNAYPQRIGYVHLKQVDVAVMERVAKEQLSFAQAVRLGAMCEPPHGVPEMEPVLGALDGLNADLFAIVEQDLYPCDPDVPLPIATRTRQFFNRCGLGPSPRRS
jgi:inosose dehydratase